jgi:hypothetical protein
MGGMGKTFLWAVRVRWPPRSAALRETLIIRITITPMKYFVHNDTIIIQEVTRNIL